jgi:hypothetical protein
LPEAIFDMAINSSGTVTVYLQDNNWHCDCDLAWLRNYMDKQIINVRDEPMCTSPQINKNKSLREADFSDCSTITSSTEITTVTTPSSIENGHVVVNCSCTDCSTTYRPISTETNTEASSLGKNNIISIEVKEDDRLKQIHVTIEGYDDYVLIWMTTNDAYVTACNFKDYIAETEYISIYPNTAYMICAAHRISENKITISTLNCRAITTLPIPLFRAWLKNRDRVTLFCILFAAGLVSLIVGAATIYCVLLHFPQLINYKKKRANIFILRDDSVIIMPKG